MDVTKKNKKRGLTELKMPVKRSDEMDLAGLEEEGGAEADLDADIAAEPDLEAPADASAPADLDGVSDDDLLAELEKRGLMGKLGERDDDSELDLGLT